MSNNHVSIVGGDVPANQETYDAVREYIVEAQKQVNADSEKTMFLFCLNTYEVDWMTKELNDYVWNGVSIKPQTSSVTIKINQ